MRLRADRREERRREALLRNEAWQALSTADKLKSLSGRPGASKRQHQRLSKALERSSK